MSIIKATVCENRERGVEIGIKTDTAFSYQLTSGCNSLAILKKLNFNAKCSYVGKTIIVGCSLTGQKWCIRFFLLDLLWRLSKIQEQNL